MRQCTCHGAIAETGAEVSTFPKSVLNENASIVDRTRDADPDTAVCYGNGQVEYISTIAESGDYDIEVAPEHCSNCLISVDAIRTPGQHCLQTLTERRGAGRADSSLQRGCRHTQR